MGKYELSDSELEDMFFAAMNGNAYIPREYFLRCMEFPAEERVALIESKIDLVYEGNTPSIPECCLAFDVWNDFKNVFELERKLIVFCSTLTDFCYDTWFSSDVIKHIIANFDIDWSPFFCAVDNYLYDQVEPDFSNCELFKKVWEENKSDFEFQVKTENEGYEYDYEGIDIDSEEY